MWCAWWITEDSWMRGHSTSLHDWDSVHFLQYAEEIKWLFVLSSTIVQCLWIARRPPVFCSPEYYCVVSISSSLTFKKEECKSSKSKQVTQHNVTLIVRKAQNPIFISAVFCLRYCQSRKGSKLNNWELIAPAKRLNQNCDAECLSVCNSPDSSLCPLSCLSLPSVFVFNSFFFSVYFLYLSSRSQRHACNRKNLTQ